MSVLKNRSIVAKSDKLSSLNSPEMDHPEPPLFLEREGETYVLQANESIRRSEEKIISYVRKPIDWDSADGQNVDEHILRTTSESVLDLDANEKSVKCEVSCVSYNTSQGCLTLTASSCRTKLRVENCMNSSRISTALQQ